jgi:hypothetical protein
MAVTKKMTLPMAQMVLMHHQVPLKLVILKLVMLRMVVCLAAQAGLMAGQQQISRLQEEALQGGPPGLAGPCVIQYLSQSRWVHAIGSETPKRMIPSGVCVGVFVSM